MALRPQPGGRAQYHENPAGSTLYFPCSTTITTSALGDALRIRILSEEVGGRSRGKMQER